MSDGTALGCIGRCKVCGKAIQLRRVIEFGEAGHEIEVDTWLHFGAGTDHYAELSPGVGEYYDEQIAEQKAEYERECARQLRAGRCPHSGLRLHPHGNAAAVSDLSCDVCDCFGYSKNEVGQ